ncbi:MAG: C40 family peptidase, partial [Hydrogenobacter sp.]
MTVIFLILFFSIAQSLEVSKINSQVLTLIPYVVNLKDFPEKLKGDTVKEWMFKDVLPMDKSFVDNTNLEGVPQEIKVSFGWTLRRTNMRMYPTDLAIYKNNKDI